MLIELVVIGFIFFSTIVFFCYITRHSITLCCRHNLSGIDNESNTKDTVYRVHRGPLSNTTRKTINNDVITLCCRHNFSGLDNENNTRGAVEDKTGKTLVEPGFCRIERDGGSFGALPSRQFFGGLTCLKFLAVPLNNIHNDVKPTEFEDCKDFAQYLEYTDALQSAQIANIYDPRILCQRFLDNHWMSYKTLSSRLQLKKTPKHTAD